MDRSAVLLFTVQLLLVVYEVLTQVVWFYGVDDVKVPEDAPAVLFPLGTALEQKLYIICVLGCKRVPVSDVKHCLC